jgi:hypothetical protein
MKIQSHTSPCSIVLFFVASLFSFRSVVAQVQDATPAASQSELNFALRYYGSNGLSKSAPKNNSIITHVEIVYGTKLTEEDITFLSTLNRVEDLSIGGILQDEFVEIEGSLAPLGKLNSLKSVFLCKNNMQDIDLEFVSELPAVECLEFVGNTNPIGQDGPAVTDDSAVFLSRATSLRDLCIIGGDRLTDRFVSVISRNLKNLEHLDIDSGLLTDQSLQMLAERCRSLRWLDLHSDHFTDKGVAYLANAKKMEMLWLGSRSLTQDCVESVSGLVHLKHLELTVPTITDAGVQTLASLPALEILALRQPPLTDEQFAMFANHPTIQSMFLNGSDLTTEKAIDVIKSIPNIDHLECGKNRSLQAAVNRFFADRKAKR